MKTIKFKVRCMNGDGERELSLPGKNEVCSRCDGEGKHSNPAIDGNGLSSEDFDQDPDFEEAYFSGRYDVRCEECNGEKVVPVIDFERLPKKLRERIETQLSEEASWKAEQRQMARLRERGIEY